MALHNRVLALALILSASLCAGCGIPHYDVPTDTAGQPTVATIVARIQCELRDMVRDDRPTDPATFHRLFLLNGDYDVEIALSLEVNDTGGLAPTLSYMNPFTSSTSFMFGGTGTLSESRDHNFTENIQLSLRQIFLEWKTGANPHDCPNPDTNLSGALGLSDFVAMASLTQGLDQTQKLSGKGVFGGTIQFIVTKSLSALGPTWTLLHFKGPGGLLGLSEVNTDKVTFAFALGPNVGKPMPHVLMAIRRPVNYAAQDFLTQLVVSQITSQLVILQNSLQTNP
jgi:hypothetical protein